MELLDSIKHIWLNSLWWWGGLCVAFLVLTRWMPCNPGRDWWKDPRGAVTDFVYWLVMPILGQLGRIVLLVVGVMLLYGKNANPDFTAREWPLWAQCAIILLLQDVMMYWIHRLFHSRAGWKFHAIHHSSETLDWTSASRFHPVNAFAEFAVVDAVVLLAGFSPVALATLGPINLVYSAMVHANLNWTFGPLRYIFASPVFHRWHHTTEHEGLDKNFAPTFPFLDWIFGTFYMPVGVRPQVYGANEAELPAGPVGQTLYPFRGIGSWTIRHPVYSTVSVAAKVCISVVGWRSINQSVSETQTPETPAMAELPVDRRPAMQPEFLPIDLGRDPKATNAVAVNAAGSLAIYGLRDGSVAIRDTATKRESSFIFHRARVNALAISPGGKIAVSASADGNANVFDAHTGEVRRVLSHKGTNLMCVAVGDDGWVVTGGVDGIITLWAPQGELKSRRALQLGSINALALSDGGRQIVAAQGSSVSSWSVASGQLTQYDGLNNLAYCVNISSDGKRIVAGEYDGRLHLWDLDNQKARRIMTGHDGPIYSVSLSPDGDSIISGGADQFVRVWNAGTGALTKKLEGHTGLIFSVSFDTDRQRILAAGKDNALTDWNTAGGEIIPVSGIKR